MGRFARPGTPTDLKISSALPDQMETFDREGIAQIQRVEACSDRKSRSTFSELALVNIRAANVCNKRRVSGWTGVRQKVVPPVKRKNWV
jgi:hypothetical protein